MKVDCLTSVNFSKCNSLTLSLSIFLCLQAVFLPFSGTVMKNTKHEQVCILARPWVTIFKVNFTTVGSHKGYI